MAQKIVRNGKVVENASTVLFPPDVKATKATQQSNTKLTDTPHGKTKKTETRKK